MGLCPKAVLLLVISLALLATLSKADLAPEAAGDGAIHVTIMNALGSPLLVHCKSKDNDLGDHVLPFTATWQFSFKPNVWGTTRFFCRLAWGNESHYFDIFVYNRDFLKCHNCVWKILPSGPCRLKENTSDNDVCYGWH